MTATLFADAPKVGTFHAAGESAGYRVMGWALKRLAARLDHRVAVSPDAMALAQGALGGEYELLFNGIEVEHFATGPVHPIEAPTIFFLGRHEPRKGLDVLLAALADLPRDVRVWVGGDGPQSAELRERFGHDPRIEWLGRISDADRAARMRACTVYCSPSVRGESFGMVLLEAMASGCALVASDLDGHRNVASDGVDALLTPVGDAAALAKAIRRVLDDDALRAELVAGGRRRADQLSMAHLAERYEAIYRSVQRR
jgi:phosphatidylinositol alpha-mannosyltransferase